MVALKSIEMYTINNILLKKKNISFIIWSKTASIGSEACNFDIHYAFFSLKKTFKKYNFAIWEVSSGNSLMLAGPPELAHCAPPLPPPPPLVG